jgi:hypothetical protein
MIIFIFIFILDTVSKESNFETFVYWVSNTGAYRRREVLSVTHFRSQIYHYFISFFIYLCDAIIPADARAYVTYFHSKFLVFVSLSYLVQTRCRNKVTLATDTR